MADQLKEEGLALFQRGLQDEALEKFQQAADAFAQAGDGTGRGEMLNNIGVIERVRRNWTEAEQALQEAAQLFEHNGDQNRQAQALGNLGDLYAARGQREQAIQHYSDAAAQFALDGDGEKQSQVLRTLSLYYLRQRQILPALVVMERSYEAKPRLNLAQRLFYALLRFVPRLMGGQ